MEPRVHKALRIFKISRSSITRASSRDQWERIKDLLPGLEDTAGAKAQDNRLFVEAVLYRYRTSVPWRDLPERFGDWKNHSPPSPKVSGKRRLGLGTCMIGMALTRFCQR
jgi:transposase